MKVEIEADVLSVLAELSSREAENLGLLVIESEDDDNKEAHDSYKEQADIAWEAVAAARLALEPSLCNPCSVSKLPT